VRIDLPKLIVNGDDFGYSSGVNRGIIKAIEQGIVTSTTLLMNSEATQEAINHIKAGRVADVGVHLCLTSGRPLTKPGLVPALVDRKGCFPGRDYLLDVTLPANQIERELRAQLEKALAVGIRVTHLDSHHHIHQNKSVLEVMVKLAQEYALPIRSVNPGMVKYLTEQGIITPTGFIGDFYGADVSAEKLLSLLRETGEKVTKMQGLKDKSYADIKETAINRGDRFARDVVIELMVHPACVDEYLLVNSSYTYEREKELAVLTDRELFKEIDKMGYELISYAFFAMSY
jgi:predicted glycoside hydrolase/deacetylase ChbG (UPF0249 family)